MTTEQETGSRSGTASSSGMSGKGSHLTPSAAGSNSAMRFHLSAMAKKIGLHVKVLRRAIRRGHLPASQPGQGANASYYVTEQDVSDWLNNHRARRRV